MHPSSTSETLALEVLTPAIGAVVHGVDLSRPLEEDAWQQVHAAFLAHHVLFFPEQQLTVDDYVRFAERFGTPDTPRKLKGETLHPVVPVLENDGSKPVVGARWHADNTDFAAPPLGAMLYCETLPALGGDTLWASTAAAYDALDARLRQIIDPLQAVHDNSRVRARYGDAGMLAGDAQHITPQAVHPVVRTHPQTGRKSLFVNAVYTQHIVGLAEHESRHLLDLLLAHVARPEFQVRHRWRERTLAVWDNRATQHYAVADYRGRRRMWRIEIQGDRPV